MNLNTTIDLDLKKFFHWWLRELDFLIPDKLRQRIVDKQGMVIIRPIDNQFELSFLGDIRQYRIPEQQSGDHLITLTRGESGITAFQTLLANDDRLHKVKWIMRLTPQHAIHKELVLPVAVKENLSQVIAYEMDRYTPFKVDQVYFAVRTLEVDHDSGLISVLLILTPREIFDTLYQDIKAFGISPLVADYQNCANDLSKIHDGYNLLPESYREKFDTTPRLIYGLLIATIVLLLTSILVLPVWSEYQTVETLQQRIDAIEKGAKGVKALQSEMDAMINETQLLITEKKSAPSVLGMLNALSELIKDDTWLAYAQYADGHLQMQGESPAASALIGVLEESDWFANVKFVSPITQDKVSKQERFQITADVLPVTDTAPSSTKSTEEELIIPDEN